MSFKTNIPISLVLHAGMIFLAATICPPKNEPPKESCEEPIHISVELVEASAEHREEPAPAPVKTTETATVAKIEPKVKEEYLPEPEMEHAPDLELEAPAEYEEEKPAESEEESLSESEIAEEEPEQESEKTQEATERPEIVAEPFALSRIEPSYPRSARRKGHEGCVTVEVEINENGGVERAEVIASSGFPELDRSAVSAVRSADFSPAKRDGVSVCGKINLTFNFKLR